MKHIVKLFLAGELNETLMPSANLIIQIIVSMRNNGIVVFLHCIFFVFSVFFFTTFFGTSFFFRYFFSPPRLRIPQHESAYIILQNAYFTDERGLYGYKY